MLRLIPRPIKTWIKKVPPMRRAWTSYHAGRLEREYCDRREHYERRAAQERIVYREEDVVASIRRRIAHRGYSPQMKKPGEVHTFVCIPMISWHPHLLPDLKKMGPVSFFDYTQFGFKVDELMLADRHAVVKREQMIQLLFPALLKAHQERPVDWVLFLGGGKDVSAAVVCKIAEYLGIPTVNMSFDDKHCWSGPFTGEHRAGSIDLTAAFDLFMTSSRISCEWHLLENGRPIYLPEGFDCSYCQQRDVPKDIDVSFVGEAYGFRPALIDFLKKQGIRVAVFGRGWPGGCYASDPVDVFNRSKINLGMGGIGFSESLTNVKGRDFDIPGTGGGVYLTTFNPDLAQHFHIGREIWCYRNRHEMIELIRYCLRHAEETVEASRAARRRALNEHRWLHRYQHLLRILQILPEDRQPGI